MAEGIKKLPPWLSKRAAASVELSGVNDVLERLKIATVCREARCPNLCECFARGTATFMILGRICTRNCRFCAVCDGRPSELDRCEPQRVAAAVEELQLDHVVVTSVTRDDLAGGGSVQFAQTIKAIRNSSDAAVEVLTPDFQGAAEDIDRVIDAGPDIYNHNIETVPRLYGAVRPQADYRRSLDLLRRAASAGLRTKSGLMLGLGESEAEVMSVMQDLHSAGCKGLTLGQYLAPSAAHHPVKEFVTPEKFDRLGYKAYGLGFAGVASAPFVRSSYNAREFAVKLFGEY